MDDQLWEALIDNGPVSRNVDIEIFQEVMSG